MFSNHAHFAAGWLLRRGRPNLLACLLSAAFAVSAAVLMAWPNAAMLGLIRVQKYEGHLAYRLLALAVLAELFIAFAYIWGCVRLAKVVSVVFLIVGTAHVVRALWDGSANTCGCMGNVHWVSNVAYNWLSFAKNVVLAVMVVFADASAVPTIASRGASEPRPVSANI